MSALGHILEQEGVATVSISLIREHTEKVRPPRALWVPFELGRPFGAPRDPGQQTRVLKAALALLERSNGPVILEDSSEQTNTSGPEEMSGMFCAIALPKPAIDQSIVGHPCAGHIGNVRAEIDTLAPWYALSLEQNGGRSTTGLSGLDLDAILIFFAAMLYETAPQPAPGFNLAQTLRFASEDLRSWYLEAAATRPGGKSGSAAAAADWFWGETAAGKLLLALQALGTASADKDIRWVANRTLVPRSQAHRLMPKSP